MKFHRFVADAFFIGFLVSANASFAAERCSLAWSHYTGWEPLGFIDSSGIAQKWGEKYGVDLNIQLINDYIESVNLYTAGAFDGVSVTNMDGLTIPAVGGVDTTVLVIGNRALRRKTGSSNGRWPRSGTAKLLKEQSAARRLLQRTLGATPRRRARRAPRCLKEKIPPLRKELNYKT